MSGGRQAQRLDAFEDLCLPQDGIDHHGVPLVLVLNHIVQELDLAILPNYSFNAKGHFLQHIMIIIII